MRPDSNWSPQERLVHHIHELERLDELKKRAADNMRDGFRRASADGFDEETLKVVLKLRKLPPHEVQEKRALENIYLVALGMLDETLSDVSRKRLDEEQRRQRGDGVPPPQPPAGEPPQEPPAVGPEQGQMQFKTPEEAFEEGRQAGREGKSILDNPYSSKEPVNRAKWDHGWCMETKSNGMEPNKAWGRRTKDSRPDRERPPGDGADEAADEPEREKEDA